MTHWLPSFLILFAGLPDPQLNVATADTCPLDGAHFNYARPFHATQHGYGSDLRPLGAPLPQAPECPKCHFVLGDWEAAEQVPEMKALVATPAFTAAAAHAAGFRLALQREATGKKGWALCRPLLEASWVETQGSSSWLETTARLVQCLGSLEDPGALGDEQRRAGQFETAALLTVDVLRQRGAFPAALEAADRASAHPLFRNQPYADLLVWERQLVARGSMLPEPLPELTKPGPQDQPALRLAMNLPGHEQALQRVRIERAEVGAFNWEDKSLFLIIHSTEEQRLVDQAWWHNLVVGGQPNTGWEAFLKTFDDVEAVAGRHAWLTAWKQGSRDRHVEVWMVGNKGNAQADQDAATDQQAWRHAGLSGVPKYQLVLRQGSSAIITVLLSARGVDGVLTSITTTGAVPSQPAHWLDGQELFFHPASGGDYVRIHNGTLEKRHLNPGKKRGKK